MALEQPKKPVGGAYGIFLTQKRPEYTKACAGKRASEISKMAGAAWKELNDSQKKPYEEKYVAAKAKFDVDMAAFLAAGGEKSKGLLGLRTEKRKAKEGKKAKKAKDANMPKRPAGGGYGQFLAENRAKIVASLPKDHKMTDVGKAAGGQWRALSEAAKKPYEDAFAKKNMEFKKAMEEYKAANPEAEPEASEEDEEEAEEKPTKAKVEKESKVSKKRAASSPPAKKIAKAKKGSAKEVEIDVKVLKEAETLGFVSQIKNLAARPDVASSGKSQKEMLDALKKNEGLVNKAKSALLGA